MMSKSVLEHRDASHRSKDIEDGPDDNDFPEFEAKPVHIRRM